MASKIEELPSRFRDAMPALYAQFERLHAIANSYDRRVIQASAAASPALRAAFDKAEAARNKAYVRVYRTIAKKPAKTLADAIAKLELAQKPDLEGDPLRDLLVDCAIADLKRLSAS